jgi:deoxycytidylate deaminase
MTAVLSKLKKVAMNNGEVFHLAAILFRGKRIVKVGTNSNKTHPKFVRMNKDGTESAELHAEMSVIRFAKPGDTLLVVRYNAIGELSMSKPCIHCQKFIKESGISKVEYTDWNGDIKDLKFEPSNG